MTAPARRAGYALLALGAVLVGFSLGSGASTMAACPGAATGVYDLRVAGRGFASVVEWHDGCNWHTHPFVPLAAGFACLLGGAPLALESDGAATAAGE